MVHWRCRSEIDWPGTQQVDEVYGFDAVQAIVLALCGIGMSLYGSDAHKTGRLVWSPSRGGYGFPVLSAARDQLRGDDRML